MDKAALTAYADAAAAALELPIPAACKPGVVGFLALAAGMAEQVMAEPLTHEDESGSVFRPVAPRGPAA